ncbi:MAG: SpoIIE family protein phosphatase [Bacteroidia bacterium]|nr:SpoIIE family protein phosphatase [Bacteroidia bacterium]
MKLNHILGEHFILFKPKDIVSGDFYWATCVNQWLIVTVTDCTGHGVPGAFMSMLAVSFLNEIVRKKEVTNAAMVLNHLRFSVIEAIKQSGKEGEQKDGMDMSLAVINTKTKQCQWTGANNPLWIIKNTARNKEYTDIADIVEEIKPDKMPVAIHVKMNDFTNHEIQLYEGDKLFLFSDGYPDQFGGANNKKFKYSTFKKLIAETSALSMKEQGEQIKMALDKWMNYEEKKYEQIDDITVIGLKI